METIDTAAAFELAAAAQHGLSGSVLARSVAAAVQALRTVPTDVADYRALDESTLLTLNILTAQAARLTQTHAALLAGEIARRSAPELGSQGLAQRAGHRTPEQLVKITTGASGRAATTAVRTGVLLGQLADEGAINAVTGEVAVPAQPWLRPVSVAVRAGELSVEAADAISFWLGSPNSAVTADQLAELAVELVTVARVRPDGTAGLDVDQLMKLTRMRREEADLDGVRIREDEQRAARASGWSSCRRGWVDSSSTSIPKASRWRSNCFTARCPRS